MQSWGLEKGSGVSGVRIAFRKGSPEGGMGGEDIANSDKWQICTGGEFSCGEDAKNS